jgi:hypothetical protein
MSEKARMWMITPNKGEEWDLSDIHEDKGKRIVEYWVESVKNSMKCISKLTIPLDDGEGDGKNNNTFHRCIIEAFNYDELTCFETLTLFNGHNYKIHGVYIPENNVSVDDFNYFVTMTNLGKVPVYKKVLVFKATEEGIIDLDMGEMLELLANLYIFKSYKLKGGNFEELSINNYEPIVMDRMKSYNCKTYKSWSILCERKDDMDNFKVNGGNKVEDFKDTIIFIKKKDFAGDMAVAMDTSFEHDKKYDYRGIFSDINMDLIMNTFF